MAKAIGLIGNYTGKLGNTVGYNLKDSNNKQTQGVRVYQPVVKNPRTAGQAEQRAKLAPINATYRLLKDVIDRGQEGVAYGNKSRLKWLKDTLKSFNGPWFEKGDVINLPVFGTITNGSLPSVNIGDVNNDNCSISALMSSDDIQLTTVGLFTTEIMKSYPFLQDGDQMTFILIDEVAGQMATSVVSIILQHDSNDPLPFTASAEPELITFSQFEPKFGFAIVISREGDNGEHLRSTSNIFKNSELEDDKTDSASKQAAVASYMSQGANTDWAEESIM